MEGELGKRGTGRCWRWTGVRRVAESMGLPQAVPGDWVRSAWMLDATRPGLQGAHLFTLFISPVFFHGLLDSRKAE